ncbi:hypothetical protein, partial [Thiorhodococcus mannitoliphagus]|uniref:hypothetical protein n=1 Tax=Thiorhodococcus mannitoliphagus TaxID=329406 RepID=UPI00197D9119
MVTFLERVHQLFPDASDPARNPPWPQYRSMAQHNALLEGFGRLRRMSVVRPLLGPFAHLLFDDAGIDP